MLARQAARAKNAAAPPAVMRRATCTAFVSGGELRYTVEFFAPLYKKKKVKRYLVAGQAAAGGVGPAE